MLSRAAGLVGIALCLASCGGVYAPNQPLRDAVKPSTPLVWRVDSRCMAGEPPWQELSAATRVDLARACRRATAQTEGDRIPRDLVFMAMSGGGAKASTFAGESMFYLQAIGLLQKTAMMSSVSGGSFAAAYYALSCDPHDLPCQLPTANGVLRPLWRYDEAMPVLQSGFLPMLVQAAVNFFVPGVTTPVEHRTFGEFIDRNYLRRKVNGIPAGSGPARFTDLNPRRPLLVLNSTLLSGARQLTDSARDATGGHDYLRRRTADEFLHFSFTDYYFNQIGADLGNYAVSDAVASSAAFPALVGYAALKNYRACAAAPDHPGCADDPKTMLTLTDGGANDNQGLIEVFAAMAEVAAREARSDLSSRRHPSPSLERMRGGDHALVLVLNSSLTEATGVETPVQRDYLFGTINRALSAVDAYSAVGFNLRKRLYSAELDVLQAMRPDMTLQRVEISLAPLNRYREGGAELAYMADFGVLDDTPYSKERKARLGQVREQRGAYAHVSTPTARRDLMLGRLHPQCLFEQSKVMEKGITSLARLSDHNAICLRHAARWATALRGEELCRAEHAKPGSVLADRAALSCTPDGHLAPIRTGVLGDLAECDLSRDKAGEADDIRRALAGNPTFLRDLSGGRTMAQPWYAAQIARPLPELCDLDDPASAASVPTSSASAYRP